MLTYGFTASYFHQQVSANDELLFALRNGHCLQAQDNVSSNTSHYTSLWDLFHQCETSQVTICDIGVPPENMDRISGPVSYCVTSETLFTLLRWQSALWELFWSDQDTSWLSNSVVQQTKSSLHNSSYQSSVFSTRDWCTYVGQRITSTAVFSYMPLLNRNLSWSALLPCAESGNIALGLSALATEYIIYFILTVIST